MTSLYRGNMCGRHMVKLNQTLKHFSLISIYLIGWNVVTVENGATWRVLKELHHREYKISTVLRFSMLLYCSVKELLLCCYAVTQ